MQKIKNNKKFFIAVLSVSLLVFIIIYYSQRKDNNDNNIEPNNTTSSQTPAPTLQNKVEDWKQVIPGTTDIAEMQRLLGNPKTSENNDSLTINTYQSNTIREDHYVIFDNNKKLIFGKQIVSATDNLTYAELSKQNENINETLTLYSELSNFGFNLYANPQKGIAYLANKNSGEVLEIWRFIPTTDNRFIDSYASDYYRNQSEVEVQH